MEFKNYMEELVSEVLDSILKGKKEFCGCERCRVDVMAFALNHLPAKYVVTDIGRARTKLEAVKTQFQVDVVKELAIALEKVRKNARH